MEIVIVCVAGLAAPTAAEKFTVVVDSAMTGLADTTSVTVTVWGLLLATGDVMVTVAVYVPTASAPTVACRDNVAGAVVAFNVAPSQAVL